MQLKTQLLHQVQNTQAVMQRVLETQRLSIRNGLSALFIPPADQPGSLGDDAMLIASIQYLHQHGLNRAGVVAFEPDGNWNYLEHLTDVVPLKSPKDKLAIVKALSRFDRVYCLGADTMDGFYSDNNTLKRLRLVQLAAEAGVNTTVLGFSFNDRPSSLAVNAVAKLPANVRLCARDPVSYRRLTQHLQRPVELVADLAFLLQPEQTSQVVVNVSEWVRSQRASDRIVIGVNAKNLYHGENHNLQSVDLAQVYVAALTELFQTHPNLSFLLIPHDVRGNGSDVALAEAIAKALPAEIQPYHFQVPMPCSPAEIKAICGELDLVISGRMHLAIACLGQATPVIGVTYQGKFEGLFELFGLQEMLIEPEVATQTGRLSAEIANWIPQRQHIRQQIQSHLEKVRTLASKNFADLNVPSLRLAEHGSGVSS